MKIAIIGSGIAGLTCAHLLDPDHDVTVFESGDRVGGHTNTVDVTVTDNSGRTESFAVDFDEKMIDVVQMRFTRPLR